MAGRFDDDEKRLEKENSIGDATQEVFYDDMEQEGETNGVYVMRYFSDQLGTCYSIQVPNCNIWVTEEMFKRLGSGVEKAMADIRSKELTN